MSQNYEMKCPHCGTMLRMDEILMEKVRKECLEKDEALLQAAMESQKAKLAEESERRIREGILASGTEQAEQIRELTADLKRFTESNAKLTEQVNDLLAKQFELQQKVQSAEAEARAKLNGELQPVIDNAVKVAVESKDAEIESLKKRVKDAQDATSDIQRKLDQKSQQLQGEVYELRLEDCLRAEFPLDEVDEVAKGAPGADVVQTVRDRSGRTCGRIVWESKNVKTWKNEFIPKLRVDMERVDGTVGVLMSNVFGRNMAEFTMEDGVWLVRPHNALAIARLLRDGILKAGAAKMYAEIRGSAQDAVYEFVTSQAFRNRIENIGSQYLALDAEIANAKKTMDRHWSKQRKLIDQLVENTQGLLGEVDSFIIQPSTKASLPEPRGDKGCDDLETESEQSCRRQA